ncbi:monooxygenase [Vanrija albida]|uniref:Monooxygenase n=1 Tax=Vanrija albida TaxID=181172 RepID=A0ABR3Q2D9_9TREE
MTVDIDKPKVLIIGAGPAGLGAIEQFLSKGFDVVAFDARSRIGGLWADFDATPPEAVVTFDEYGQPIVLSENEHKGLLAPAPTPMYAGVIANTPRDIMTYRQHPYPPNTPFLPTYKQMKAYQERYAEKYLPFIRHNRIVTRVRYTPSDHAPATPDGRRRKWLVEWTPTATSGLPDVGTPYEEQFDNIVVANGSDSRPYVPYIAGLWDWKGQITHSRWYRRAEDFANKTVLVVGSGSSSADIVRELGMTFVEGKDAKPKKVYRSIRSEPRLDAQLDKGWKDHIHTIGSIDQAWAPSAGSPAGRLRTVDGVELDDVDVIIFATSYVVRFEFLRPADEPFASHPIIHYPQPPKGSPRPPPELVGKSTYEGGLRAHNLDSFQVFYLPDPTIAFLLLHAEAISWPFAELQAHAVATYWSSSKPAKLVQHPDEANEAHSVVVLGHPAEFDYATKLLAFIGEGGPEEVTSEGKWGEWADWKKRIREFGHSKFSPVAAREEAQGVFRTPFIVDDEELAKLTS